MDHESLNALIRPDITSSLNCRSRVHPLRGYIRRAPEGAVMIKREDELNPCAMGSKQRKYLSLLHHIERQGIDKVIAIGSAHSNNLVGLASLLRSNGIGIEIYVKQPAGSAIHGNWLLLKMLLDGDCIHPVPSGEWAQIEQQVSRQADTQGTLIIPEGADCPEVIPGILTLATDICRNQQELGLCFSDIWTDSGTGISSIGLLLGMQLMQITEARVHVTLIAGSEQAYLERYHRFERWTGQWLGRSLLPKRPELIFHQPATAAAFGSINKTILRETLRISRETGILMDPVYSAKHLYTVQQQLAGDSIMGRHLILYNGGPLGMCGFQRQLAEVL